LSAHPNVREAAWAGEVAIMQRYNVDHSTILLKVRHAAEV
jgi:hypothetical protein